MKKNIILLVAAMLMVSLLSACNSAQASSNKDEKLQIVTTIFPEYDWTVNVLGENYANADVTLLLDNGVDLHSFQPTAADILKISNCDLFIYVGGESDEWVDDVLRDKMNKNMVVVNLLDVLGDSVKEEEIVEGMQAEEEHDHAHEDADDHDHEDGDDHDTEHDHEDGEEHEHDEEEIEYDEHVWLSLRNSATLVGEIANALGKADPSHAKDYQANAKAYQEKLNALDAKYQEVISDAKVKTVLFGDRFPFRYLVDDYGLSYYAAFVGCSAETEASFETIMFLANKTDELGLPAIMTIEGKDHRIAETIRDNTKAKDQEILTMDSLQATTLRDYANGATYLRVMEMNLDVLKQALN